MTVGEEIGAVGLEAYCSPPVDANGVHQVDLDPEPAAIALVAAAKTSLLINAYSLTLTALAAAIIAAHQRGVTVRVVQDATEYAATNSQGPVLLAAGIDLRVWGTEYALAHEKVIVADGATVLSGSWNFTTQAEKSNKEICTIVSGAKVRKVLAPLVTAQIQTTYEAGVVPA